jgi:hypothetical protein
VMFAERLGLTGIGGGGAGESRVSRDRCRLFKVVSSSLRARDLEVEVMAFEVGSRWMGRSVKVSVSSMAIVSMGTYCMWCCMCWRFFG